MHLCFIDESGSAPKPGKIGARPFFVIAGVIMHEAQWHGVESDLNKLRGKFKVAGEIKWRYFGPENTDEGNSVAHLSQAERDEFRTELFDIVVRRKSIKIVACVCKCEEAFKKTYVKSDEDIYLYTYKPISERFQYYLQDVSATVGDKQLGIMVADHRGTKQDSILRDRHRKLVGADDMHVSAYKNYVEMIFLSPSHLSIGIQLADMVAGAIARAYNTSETKWADQIHSSLRAKSDGSVEGYGLVKFPHGWKR